MEKSNEVSDEISDFMLGYRVAGTIWKSPKSTSASKIIEFRNYTSQCVS